MRPLDSTRLPLLRLLSVIVLVRVRAASSGYASILVLVDALALLLSVIVRVRAASGFAFILVQRVDEFASILLLISILVLVDVPVGEFVAGVFARADGDAGLLVNVFDPNHWKKPVQEVRIVRIAFLFAPTLRVNTTADIHAFITLLH